MPDRESQAENIEYLKQKSGEWSFKLEAEVEKLINADSTDKDKLFEVLWEDGVLNRIVPADLEAKNARQQLGRTVWPGSREDPALYLRILYSCAFSEEALKRNYSIVADSRGLITGAFNGFNQALYSEKAFAFFPEYKTGKNPSFEFLAYIADRAKAELKKIGVQPPDKIIPWDAEGVWQGIKVVVDRSTSDGRLAFRAKDPKDSLRLSEELRKTGHDYGVVPAEEINPDDFHLPDKK
ncbi:MAG: hypothetical protein WCT08_05280 [Patescibacteria group bacterium]|jgi:hypothetical protein